MKNSLQRVELWCKENRHLRLPDLFKQLNTKLTGYYKRYNVHGNSPSLALFYRRVTRYLRQDLNQRSQRKSYNWGGFKQLLAHFGLVRPYIVHRPRRARKAFVPGLT